MNKPATKEPSMDEILSSIRQIIADDDAAAAKPSAPMMPVAAAPSPIPAREPLALSSAQMIPRAEPPRPVPAPTVAAPIEVRPMSQPEPADYDEPVGEAELLDPEDVAFEGDPEPMAPPPPPARPAFRMPDPPRRSDPIPPRAPSSVSQAAPMPDPTLSSDLAEELLSPATNAAIQGTLGKLNAMTAVGTGQTIEDIMRQMLKPMLKEWLDENLPAVVERMVEKEISRISRGVK